MGRDVTGPTQCIVGRHSDVTIALVANHRVDCTLISSLSNFLSPPSPECNELERHCCALQRETRVQPAQVEEVATRSDSVSGRKKKRPNLIASTFVNAASARSTASEDVVVDSSYRARAKSKAQTVLTEEEASISREHVRPTGSHGGKSKRKERSGSHDATHHHSKKALSPDSSEDERASQQSIYAGPLATADYNRMKLELENLRKQMSTAKKTISKQSKTIDELKRDLALSTSSHKELRKDIEKFKSFKDKNEEMVASVESNLICQICMEIMLKPCGLSPCGHVLCQDDEYPVALVYRKKSCPCCRATVRSRPIPLFLVKSLAAALDKARGGTGSSNPTSTQEDDPWEDIFKSRNAMIDYWSTDEDDEDEDDEDDGSGEDEDEYDEDDESSYDGYGTASDEEHYDGPYVAARWAPPTVHVNVEDYPFIDDLDEEELVLLRRGATLEMIQIFCMTYSHETGIRRWRAPRT
ncbi:hypothetical protein A0H81_05978 [Grifola frondosa]|uniref:RING-type domain-containing protein n=1 Tax=Grifola frondosa TaxID=5627 RepID=A0A1C7M9M0_GRIFR|nr:hypothetical protein A0H81_05978 [Grifola frondosa]